MVNFCIYKTLSVFCGPHRQMPRQHWLGRAARYDIRDRDPQLPPSMSVLRVVRQLAAPSSRALSLRSSLISARAHVPAFSPFSAAVPATRASFSVSVRRFGEGTSACLSCPPLFLSFILTMLPVRTHSRRCGVLEDCRGVGVREGSCRRGRTRICQGVQERRYLDGMPFFPPFVVGVEARY